MKKVLITGAAGFIGSNMVKFLLENTNYHIVGVDNFQGGTSNQEFIENLYIKNKDRFNFLVKNFSEVDMLDIDIVYHFAATPRVLFSVENPIDTNENNVNNTLKLLNNCKKGGV